MPKPDYNQLKTIPVPMGVLVQNNLSPSQWVAMYLMHFELYAELAAYLEATTGPMGFNEDELNDLHKRGFILYRPVPGNHEKTSSRNMKISERFTELLPAGYHPVQVVPRLAAPTALPQTMPADAAQSAMPPLAHATGNLPETLLALLQRIEQLEARVARLENSGATAGANETT